MHDRPGTLTPKANEARSFDSELRTRNQLHSRSGSYPREYVDDLRLQDTGLTLLGTCKEDAWAARPTAGSRRFRESGGVTGGGGRIRTHENLAALLVFKTSAFNHSATPPGTRILPEARKPLPGGASIYALSVWRR